jgi:hypothetical protein
MIWSHGRLSLNKGGLIRRFSDQPTRLRYV